MAQDGFLPDKEAATMADGIPGWVIADEGWQAGRLATGQGKREEGANLGYFG